MKGKPERLGKLVQFPDTGGMWNLWRAPWHLPQGTQALG